MDGQTGSTGKQMGCGSRQTANLKPHRRRGRARGGAGVIGGEMPDGGGDGDDDDEKVYWHSLSGGAVRWVSIVSKCPAVLRCGRR